MTSQEAIGRGKLILVDLIGSCVDVDHHELALIELPNMGAYIALVYLVAAPRKLFFTVTWLWCHQQFSPTFV
jgi:hypothetical protein